MRVYKGMDLAMFSLADYFQSLIFMDQRVRMFIRALINCYRANNLFGICQWISVTWVTILNFNK